MAYLCHNIQIKSINMISKYVKKSFLKKPYSSCNSSSNHQHNNNNLQRTYSLFDLICVGVGGTVGSGIFVLTGLIARQYAGPGVVFSWLVAGFACLASALSYAELSSVIPSAGSSYTYIYVALGEWPAFIAAFCLSLEYGVSAAAIARSWGDKLSAWLASVVGNHVNKL